MEERDGNCHKMLQVVVKCRKLSWHLSQIVVTFFFPSPSRRPLLVYAESNSRASRDRNSDVFFSLFLSFVAISCWELVWRDMCSQYTVSSGRVTQIIPFRPKLVKTYLNNSRNHLQSINWILWAIPPVRLGLSGRNSGRIPERPRKRSQSVSWNFPREYGWDAPNPLIQGIWGFQSVSRILSPQYGWGHLFFQNWFRRGSLRAGHGIPSSTGGISDFGNFAFSNTANTLQVRHHLKYFQGRSKLVTHYPMSIKPPPIRECQMPL